METVMGPLLGYSTLMPDCRASVLSLLTWCPQELRAPSGALLGAPAPELCWLEVTLLGPPCILSAQPENIVLMHKPVRTHVIT